MLTTRGRRTSSSPSTGRSLRGRAGTSPIAATNGTGGTWTVADARGPKLMHLSTVVSPMRTFAFRAWRSLTVRIPGGRIRAFGRGADQIGAVMVINLDRQPRRWRRVTQELGRFRTSEGLPLTAL